MSIERMKSIWLFAPHGKGREVIDRLATLGLTHVVDCGLTETDEHEALGIERVYPEAPEIERNVQLLNETFSVLDRYHKSAKGMLENFIPTPREVTADAVRKSLRDIDVVALHDDVKTRDKDLTAVGQSLQKAEDALNALGDLSGVTSTIPGASRQKSIVANLIVMSSVQYEKLQADERLKDTMILCNVAARKRVVIVQSAAPADEAEALEGLLHEAGAMFITPEEDTVTVAEYLTRRNNEIVELRKELQKIEDGLRALTKEWRDHAELTLGYWEERRRITQTTGLLAESKRLTVLRAYVRAKDEKALCDAVAEHLPDVTLDFADPTMGDAVPVSLKNCFPFSLAEFLVSMFGRPNYFTFDPSAYIITSFMIFFGFCFGDAVYGIAMLVFGTLLTKKYRDYPGPRGLFFLLTMAGIPTFIVGVITGTWAGDLFTSKYIGEGNPLTILCEFPGRFDMIEKSLMVLCVALIMGVANQLFGLVCLMIRNAKQGDYKAAIFDGGFWIMVLPMVAIGAATIFTPVPGVVTSVAYSVGALGAIGLVLTQGREEKTFVGKAMVGVVSLYGIVGTYGITGFIGDVLSYSRLLALGLTTAIVGMCFNIIAGLFLPIPYGIGVALFILVVLGGHSLNFLISILGAFVHSARLIFVEFFGKFYQGDAIPFAPLGTWTGRIRVVDEPTVWESE
jgi:V/A-type H+/Na+-transporting ATPase subunit I